MRLAINPLTDHCYQTPDYPQTANTPKNRFSQEPPHLLLWGRELQMFPQGYTGQTASVYQSVCLASSSSTTATKRTFPRFCIQIYSAYLKLVILCSLRCSSRTTRMKHSSSTLKGYLISNFMQSFIKPMASQHCSR